MSILKELGGPPSFEDATNRRQKVRAAGMDPNYWYAVEQESSIARKQIVEVKFWGGVSVALYRDESGRLHAIDNHCAHRHLPLTQGEVVGSRIVCEYHGWQYNGAGELVEVPHTLFGKKMPQCKLRTFPLRVRYGLVWIFFGDPENAEKVAMPEIPELEGDHKWECVPVEFTIRGHHSMIIDNVSDFTHEYLHRKYAPFSDAVLKRLETVGDSVRLAYDTKVGRGKISGRFVDRADIDTNYMELAYEYPYQWSNTDGKIKHWLFVLPIDEQTTRTFFLFYFDHFVVPFTKIKIPRRMMRPFLKLSNRLAIRPLLQQDQRAVEGEQAGWMKHWDEPVVELSPAVNEFQKLTVRKWEEHLAREKAKKEERELVRIERRRKLEQADASAEGAE